MGREIDPAGEAILNSWVRAYATIRKDLVAAVEEAAERGPLSAADFRAARLGRAMNDASALLKALARSSGYQVLTALPGTVAGSAEVTRGLLQDVGSSRGLRFNSPAPDVLDAIVRRTSGRVASSYRALSVSAEESLRVNLVRSVAAGTGADDAGRRMVRETRGVFGGGLSRAMNLSRTELVDAYRAGSAATRLANPDVITGWTWHARLDERTCAACWAMHGQTFGPAETLEGHQQCRCVPLPLLSFYGPEDMPLTGEEEFARLSRPQRVRTFGEERVRFLENGGAFADLAERVENPEWRPARYATPLKRLASGS